MTFYSSKKLLLGLVLGGLVSSQIRADGYFDIVKNINMPSNRVMGVVAAASFAAVSSYIALTQEKQPEIQTNNPLLKGWNWYRRVFCGQASKKSQKGYLTQTKAHMNEDGTIDFDADLKIKDCYSESSGYVGNLITWYEANEKDVTKALGVGAIVALAVINPDIKEILGGLLKKAPYNELFVIPKAAQQVVQQAPKAIIDMTKI